MRTGSPVAATTFVLKSRSQAHSEQTIGAAPIRREDVKPCRGGNLKTWQIIGRVECDDEDHGGPVADASASGWGSEHAEAEAETEASDQEVSEDLEWSQKLEITESINGRMVPTTYSGSSTQASRRFGERESLT